MNEKVGAGSSFSLSPASAMVDESGEIVVTMVIDPSALFQRNPSILFNDFDAGIMMMDIDTGHYFDIDAVGGRIWTMLDQPTSLKSVCEALAEEYDVDAETCLAETSDFFSELVTNGLIQPA